jgi:hypothetical protein
MKSRSVVGDLLRALLTTRHTISLLYKRFPSLKIEAANATLRGICCVALRNKSRLFQFIMVVESDHLDDGEHSRYTLVIRLHTACRGPDARFDKQVLD